MLSRGILDKAIEAEEKTHGDFLKLVKLCAILTNFIVCLVLSCYFYLNLYITKQEHTEGYMELSAKTKTFFATAVSLWDAEFYIKVDDDVHVNLGKKIKLFHFLSCIIHPFCLMPCSDLFVATLKKTLSVHRNKPRVYVGCMKSGPVLARK